MTLSKEPDWQDEMCAYCDKFIVYDPKRALKKGRRPVCPSCIEMRLNPLRERLGKFPIPINPNAYGGYISNE
jgi:hypothetical protein